MAYNDCEHYSVTNTRYCNKKSLIASKCLNTYVYVAACIYSPVATLVWIYVVVVMGINVVEPLSSFLIVIVANSSEWGNAYGYLYKEMLKADKKRTNIWKNEFKEISGL